MSCECFHSTCPTPAHLSPPPSPGCPSLIALPSLWLPNPSHCRPGRHFVVLGEYDRSSNSEPLQVLSISRVSTWVADTGRVGSAEWALGMKNSGHALAWPPQHPSTLGACACPILHGPLLAPQAVTHPKWNPTTFNNDVTLLKLASPARFTTRISPVCLASPNEVLPNGLKCVTTGWGRISGSSRNLGQRSRWEGWGGDKS